LTNHPGPAYSQVFGFYIPPSAIIDETAWCAGQSPQSTLKGFALAFDFEEFSDGAHEEHHVGNNNGQGIDLGNTSDESQQNCLLRLDSIRQHLIKPTDLTNGVSIIIDMAQIADIDPGKEDRNAAYSESLSYDWDACALTFGTTMLDTQETYIQRERAIEEEYQNCLSKTYRNGTPTEIFEYCDTLYDLCRQPASDSQLETATQYNSLRQLSCNHINQICNAINYERANPTQYGPNLPRNYTYFFDRYCGRLPLI
ncbi:MAG: hypothetical protein WC618_04800, partial [Patescibacteria group bacterium]